VSQLENQSDLYLSTLKRYIEAPLAPAARVTRPVAGVGTRLYRVAARACLGAVLPGSSRAGSNASRVIATAHQKVCA
jgi:hypothetical protein